MPGLDPFKLTQFVREKVTRIRNNVEELRYYRFRGGKWYGGIATGDVVGCNLRCKFCWSWRYSYFVDKGFFYKPISVFEKLISIAKRRNYKYIRLSGGEPTIAEKHLIELLDIFSESDLVFILETNGLLLGYSIDLTKKIVNYSNVVIRVSFKGTTPEEFENLTGARREFFDYQFKALENLLNEGLKPGKDFYPAVMLSFTPEDNFREFLKKLSSIHPVLASEIDIEYVILYPHVVELLRKNNLKPFIAYYPDNIPNSLI
ncbi:MAG: radical SAM protein [Desulfurococcaceae archaeon]